VDHDALRADRNRPLTAGSETKLIEAVQSAFVAAFRTPESDRDVVLDLYGENRRIVPAGRSERYTRVEIVGIAARPRYEP
jgi:hypothetical protein